MILLSAQPDDYYFTWQLQLQLENFSELGIDRNDIHILIGYNPNRGLQHHFYELIELHNDKALFFTYPDNRGTRAYAPSIRPFLIQQHLSAHTCLQQKNIFYHDSDIIFRELPDFANMQRGDTWYVSDTRNYLDSNYIKNSGGDELFNAMCNAVGINPQLVINKDKNCGGAQCLLKNTTIEFWKKIEFDSEALYALMEKNFNEKCELLFINEGKKRSAHHGIQAWCADMWALFWNALLFEKCIEIHPELDFCWSTSNIQEWNKKKILHYSGSVEKNELSFFRKMNYIECAPYYDINLEQILNNNCSYKLVELIKAYRNKLDDKRFDLNDVTFLISVRIDSESRLENLYYIVTYLYKHFKTNIIIAETDKEQKVNVSLLPTSCSYHFLLDDDPIFPHTKINNLLIKKATTKFISIHDTDAIIPTKQIIESINMLRANKCDMVHPYDGSFVSVDTLLKTMFGMMLDSDLLLMNMGKFVTGVKRSYGGAVLIHRANYIKAGMDNEFFTSWGPEDIERVKRMKNLGYKTMRIDGPLFHLPHDRKENSTYLDIGIRIQFMEEYLKICNMPKHELEEYIASWPWVEVFESENQNNENINIEQHLL